MLFPDGKEHVYIEMLNTGVFDFACLKKKNKKKKILDDEVNPILVFPLLYVHYKI